MSDGWQMMENGPASSSWSQEASERRFMVQYHLRVTDHATPMFRELQREILTAAATQRRFNRILGRISRVRRCDGCYLPMRLDFMRGMMVCDMCGPGPTHEWLEDRPRWRRTLDRLMGMDS
jgi:hypothetical protein